jgi:hypothetical protein
MSSVRVVLGVASTVVLAIAGCGGTGNEPRVASAGGTPTALASADVLTAYVEGVRSYVKCLRAEGVKVSDPDPKGRFQFEGDLGALKADPKFAAAQLTCRDLLPPRPAGLQDRPAKTAEQIDTARRYARCMRANGAPDFPDPDPDGYYPTRSGGSSGWDQTSVGARRASRACAPIIGDPARPGTGVG